MKLWIKRRVREFGLWLYNLTVENLKLEMDGGHAGLEEADKHWRIDEGDF